VLTDRGASATDVGQRSIGVKCAMKGWTSVGATPHAGTGSFHPIAIEAAGRGNQTVSLLSVHSRLRSARSPSDQRDPLHRQPREKIIAGADRTSETSTSRGKPEQIQTLLRTAKLEYIESQSVGHSSRGIVSGLQTRLL
jgi:hypothetical protein